MHISYFTDSTRKQLLANNRLNKVLSSTNFVTWNDGYHQKYPIFKIIKQRGERVDIQDLSTKKIIKRVNKYALRGLSKYERQQQSEAKVDLQLAA